MKIGQKIGFALMIGAAIFGTYHYLKPTSVSDSPAAQKSEVTVEARTIENLVLAQGSLEPSKDVEIGFTASGIVSEVNFIIGDTVHTGDVLARLDPLEFETQLKIDTANQRALEAVYRGSLADVEAAQKHFNRVVNLQKNNAVTKEAVETAQNALLSAQTKAETTKVDLDKGKISIAADENNLTKLSLIAPFDGIVTAQPFQTGQSVSSNDNAKTRVSNLTKLVNRAKVAEADIAKIKVGMSANLTTLGSSENRIPAIVARIEPTPVLESDVVLYNVLLNLDNADLALFDGMTTQVFFTLDTAKNVPTIPVSALISQGNQTQVELASGNMVNVKTGLRDRLYVQITQGLEIGDKVLQPNSTGGGGNRGPRF